jgi:hypothetical protein
MKNDKKIVNENDRSVNTPPGKTLEYAWLKALILWTKALVRFHKKPDD